MRRNWRDAWQDALYGPDGFFGRGERPAAHFRTAPLVGPEFAEAVLALLDRVDAGLDRPSRLDFVDVGAGGGELATAVAERAPAALRRRLRVVAVEIRPPDKGNPAVTWRGEPPEEVTGLLVGHEWLDAVPCPVTTVHCGQIVHVAVDSLGGEGIGEPVSERHRAWLERWWPTRAEGERAEAGVERDLAWADTVRRVRAGAALAVDYGHRKADRLAGRHRAGTLAAYRGGQLVRPVPDGTCDITAHVAMDACAAAGAAAGATSSALVGQRDALAALGLDETPPPAALAVSNPTAWLSATARAGRVAELRDATGLGRFGWLLQTTAGAGAEELLPGLPPWHP
ncbi:SAM-dependent methyltransferase [Streptoalloteichus hindustanus]|uniref:SAM-dependent methyltransferase n=1 Tax=Streptoalloteichus hindustanus TaxID=2017 RepID=UPI0009367125|nr:SAM-dependent methyltransferase [Streptoalloteichus hindustanus]